MKNPFHSLRTTSGSRVFVCSCGKSHQENLEADSTVYRRYYPEVEIAVIPGIPDLIKSIEMRYDIIHLFCDLTADGMITDEKHLTLTGTELIKKCCEENVKLLWIANANSGSHYIKGFNAKGRPLNLVMTLNRKGTKFSTFLESFLARLACGEPPPIAWAALVPQAEGIWQNEVPACIFFVGRGNVTLRA